jgi:hypothetical protein
MYAKTARFIGSGRYDTSSLSFLGIGPHDDWPAAVLWVVTLLHGCVEGIHVDVKNNSRHVSSSSLADKQSAVSGGDGFAVSFSLVAVLFTPHNQTTIRE